MIAATQLTFGLTLSTSLMGQLSIPPAISRSPRINGSWTTSGLMPTLAHGNRDQWTDLRFGAKPAYRGRKRCQMDMATSVGIRMFVF